MKNWVHVFVFVALGVSASAAYAVDFLTALSILGADAPHGADALGMGNATTAAPEFGSLNPANIGKQETSVTGTLGEINFRNGPKLRFYSLGFSTPLKEGMLQGYYSDAVAPQRTIADGSNFELGRAPTLTLMYGQPIAKNIWSDDVLNLGASVSPPSVTKISLSADGSTSDISVKGRGGVGIGALYRIKDSAAVGVTFIRSLSNVVERDAFGSISTEGVGTTQANIGVSLPISEKVQITLEHQYLKTGETVQRKFMGGGEYCPSDPVCFYLGHNGSGVTMGVGVYQKNISFNVAYARNLSSAINEHLGRAPTLMFQVSSSF